MGKRRTFYLNDKVDDLLHEYKNENNFRSMSEALYSLLTQNENQNLKINSEELKTKLNIIDKNICIMLEMVSYQTDNLDLVPTFSISNGLSRAYNGAKKLTEENIKENMINNREQSMY